jgi:hypothetical protein
LSGSVIPTDGVTTILRPDEIQDTKMSKLDTKSGEELPEDLMRNQAFPIHASMLDEAADLDDNKPGSFFMKKLYVEKPEGQDTQEEE